MRVVVVTVGLGLGLGLAACGATPVAAPAVANHAAPTPCSIDGLDSQSSELVGHLTSRADEPIFRIVDTSGVEATWTELPGDATRERARVEIHSDGLDVFGWASIAGREFVLGKRAVLVPDHVWAAKGSTVTVLGAGGGDAAAIAIPTRFDEPELLHATVPCSELVDPEARPETDDDPYVPRDLEMCGNLDLYTAPDGDAVFHATSGETWAFDRRETRQGFEHIVGGLGSIEFDGWAPVPGGGDPACHKVASNVRIHRASVMVRDASTRTLDRDTAVFAGAGGPQIGTMKAGSSVQIVDDGADFVRITMSRRAVDPGPRGFYIRADHSGSPPHHAW